MPKGYCIFFKEFHQGEQRKQKMNARFVIPRNGYARGEMGKRKDCGGIYRIAADKI